MTGDGGRVLVIEDNELKGSRVEAVVRSAMPKLAELKRATDLFEGERLVDEAGWDLLILDVSLDVRSGRGSAGQGGSDFTGGLKIAGRMFWHASEIPTIIVTAFDAFPSGAAAQDGDVILGLEDVGRQAREFLGDHLIGVVRYGSAGWEDELTGLLFSRGTTCA
jgi:hypothetical protein